MFTFFDYLNLAECIMYVLCSVKIWLANSDKLLKSSEVDQTSFSLLKEVLTMYFLHHFSFPSLVC